MGNNEKILGNLALHSSKGKKKQYDIHTALIFRQNQSNSEELRRIAKN